MRNSENHGKDIYNELDNQDDFTGDINPLYSKRK